MNAGQPPRSVTVSAPAKVNLALHVTARRPDGYHELDSLVAFADVGDRLVLEPAAAFALEISGPFAGALADVPPDDNLVLKAARYLAEAWPGHFSPVRIRLEKRLPVAAGIGGGSADAAAVITGMLRLFGRPEESDVDERLRTLALELGADVPVCLQGRPCRMQGIGERIVPLSGFPPLPAVLVNPGVPVSTPAVFARLGLAPGQPAGSGLPQPLPSTDAGTMQWLEWLSTCRNDLEEPAVAEAPVIGACLRTLTALPAVRLVRMSGSGATCVALFDQMDASEEAAQALAEKHPDWWVTACRLG